MSNRVQCIRNVTDPSQWRHVPSELNPADVATRGSTDDFSRKQSFWLQGPKDLMTASYQSPVCPSPFPLVSPDSDTEIRPVVATCKTGVNLHTQQRLDFSKFSSWSSLVNALGLLKHVCQSFKSKSDKCKGWHHCACYRDADRVKATEKFIIKTVQQEAFAPELECLLSGERLPKSSPTSTAMACSEWVGDSKTRQRR
jgi:hypothetical protein